jgi:hypothetical protein
LVGLDLPERALDLSNSSLDACQPHGHPVDKRIGVVGAANAPEVLRRRTQTLEASFDTQFGNVPIRKQRSGALSQVRADEDELRRDGFVDHRSFFNSIR